jgi:small nuclear ribonucleoprotein (snRNP)-like protein
MAAEMKPSESAAVTKVRSYLGRQMRLTLTDGRIVTGAFSVLDAFGNLLLKEASATISVDATGTSPLSPSAAASQRMGMVTVAPKHVVKVELL